MSATKDVRALTPPDVAARKGGTPLVCLTAYTTPVARLVDRHCDVVLVGDSVGMVLHGMDSTLGVTLEMMILHGKAVRPGRCWWSTCRSAATRRGRSWRSATPRG